MTTSKATSFAIVISLILLYVPAISCKNDHYEKVRVVDHHKIKNGATNIFFRGKLIITTNEQLMYDDLQTWMESRAHQQKIKFTQPNFIIDIDLLFSQKNKEYTHKSFAQIFWLNHPMNGTHTGKFEIQGLRKDRLFNFDELNEEEIKIMVNDWKDWFQDPLDEAVTYIRRHMLHQRIDGKPNYIYLHCKHGIDRTGEVSAGYLMKYKGMSLTRALELNFDIGDRLMTRNKLSATIWYCYYLKYNHNIDAKCDDGYKKAKYYLKHGTPAVPRSVTTHEPSFIQPPAPSPKIKYPTFILNAPPTPSPSPSSSSSSSSSSPSPASSPQQSTNFIPGKSNNSFPSSLLSIPYSFLSLEKPHHHKKH